MNLLFVSPRFPEGPTVGGAETLLRNLAARLAAAGHAVTFYATCASNHFTWANELPASERVVDGITVRRFPVDADRDVDRFHQVQRAISSGRRMSPADEQIWLDHNVNSRALQAALADNLSRFDRVVTGPYLFGLVYKAALRAGDKAVLVPCLHDEVFAYLDCMQRLFAGVGHIAFNAPAEQRLAMRLYGLAETRGLVVGMGMEPWAPPATGLAARLGLADRPYVLYCGRREPLKGTPMLIDYLDAFRRRRGCPVRLVLTGSGPFDVPAGFGADIVDLGFMSEADKREILAGAAVFCHPSVNESFGIVLLEAWLAGTAALVNGRSAVLVDHCRAAGGGLWFRTYPEFEAMLAAILGQDALRRALGQGGRRYVLDRYGWDAVLARFARCAWGAESAAVCSAAAM